MAVHALCVDWSTHQQQLTSVRQRVFGAELGIAADAAWDDLDDTASHFIAYNEAGIALGTARLLPSGELGHVAVLVEQRRHGVGRRLLQAVVTRATDLGMARVFVRTPARLESFYHACGFRAQVADDNRLEMSLTLPIRYEKAPTPEAVEIVNPAGNPHAERPSQLITFDSELECRETIAMLLADARRNIVLFSPTLEPELFASGTCAESFRQFARRRRASLRILVEDAKALAEVGHPLLELARRLPSKVKLRRLPDDHVPARRDFMVVDEEAVWMRPDVDAFVGWANPHDRVEARRMLEAFGWLFERSSDDPEFRLLNL